MGITVRRRERRSLVLGGARSGKSAFAEELLMRERAVELGGDCHVLSGPGAGTRVAVRLPLRPDGQG